jgi:uncharacterized protein YlaN (UPF0358 family)
MKDNLAKIAKLIAINFQVTISTKPLSHEICDTTLNKHHREQELAIRKRLAGKIKTIEKIAGASLKFTNADGESCDSRNAVINANFTFETTVAVEKFLTSNRLHKIMEDQSVSVSDRDNTYIEKEIDQDVIKSILADIGHEKYKNVLDAKKAAADKLKRDRASFTKKLLKFAMDNKGGLDNETVASVMNSMQNKFLNI